MPSWTQHSKFAAALSQSQQNLAPSRSHRRTIVLRNALFATYPLEELFQAVLMQDADLALSKRAAEAI